MEALVAVAVLVNCALIGMSGPVHRLLPEATPAQTVLVIVVLEVREQYIYNSIRIWDGSKSDAVTTELILNVVSLIESYTFLTNIGNISFKKS